jgi:hypothetical protein
MPPAFVLSQDQTLMFNPETIPSELGTDPTRAFKRYARCCLAEAKPHRFMRKRSTTRAAARASLPLSNNVNQR